MRVLFFAQLKDVTGCDAIEVAAPIDADQLWSALLERFPALVTHRGSVRLARNWEYVSPGDRFENGDEIALIPPVSGG